MALPHLEIRCDGDPQNARVFLDGHEVRGVNNYTLHHPSEPHETPIVTLEVYVGTLTLAPHAAPAAPPPVVPQSRSKVPPMLGGNRSTPNPEPTDGEA